MIYLLWLTAIAACLSCFRIWHKQEERRRFNLFLKQINYRIVDINAFFKLKESGVSTLEAIESLKALQTK